VIYSWRWIDGGGLEICLPIDFAGSFQLFEVFAWRNIIAKNY